MTSLSQATSTSTSTNLTVEAHNSSTSYILTTWTSLYHLTHTHGNTLDLVITTSDSPLSPTVSVYPTRPTDHFPVLSRLEVPSRTPPPIINRTFRRIHSIDVGKFMSDLLSEPLITQPPSSLSDLIELYNSTLSSLLDKYAPLITKPISSRPPNPWFTPYLHELKATRRRMEKAWKRSSDSYHAMRLR